jgi:hypothetical protein
VQLAIRLLASINLPENYKEITREDLILYLLEKRSECISEFKGAVENQDRNKALVELNHYVKKFMELKEPITKEKIIRIILDSAWYISLDASKPTHVVNIKRPLSGPYRSKTKKVKGTSKSTSK